MVQGLILIGLSKHKQPSLFKVRFLPLQGELYMPTVFRFSKLLILQDWHNRNSPAGTINLLKAIRKDTKHISVRDHRTQRSRLPLHYVITANRNVITAKPKPGFILMAPRGKELLVVYFYMYVSHFREFTASSRQNVSLHQSQSIRFVNFIKKLGGLESRS